MGEAPKVRRTKSRGAPADHPSRNPCPATHLPPAGAPGELSDEAQYLSSVIGRLNWMAELAMARREAAMSRSVTERDRNEACKRVEVLLAAFREEVATVEQDEQIARLEAQVAELQSTMEGLAGGVVREDHAPPFHLPEGTPPH